MTNQKQIAFERDRNWQLANKHRRILDLETSNEAKKLAIKQNEEQIAQLRREMIALTNMRFDTSTLP